MSAEPKVLHEWELAGYHGRIVETQPGIVTSEQSMDDDKRGRLWLPNRCPIGWPNEMIQLAIALRAAQAERDALRVERDEALLNLRSYVEYSNRTFEAAGLLGADIDLNVGVARLRAALATSEAARKVAEAERLTLAKVLLWNDCSECDEPGRPCGHEGAASFMVTYNQAVKLAARVSKGEEHGS